MTTNNAVNLTNTTSGTDFSKVSVKAWVLFDGTGPTILGSYNVTSVSQGSNGDYTITLTNALSNANYAVVASAGNETTSSNLYICATRNLSASTTTQFGMICRDQGGSRVQPPFVSVMVIGA